MSRGIGKQQQQIIEHLRANDGVLRRKNLKAKMYPELYDIIDFYGETYVKTKIKSPFDKRGICHNKELRDAYYEQSRKLANASNSIMRALKSLEKRDVIILLTESVWLRRKILEITRK